MIEIITGTLEERIIKLLLKTYPITVSDIGKKLHLSKSTVMRELKKFQIKGVVRLEPLPDKIYVRLLRRDFNFIGSKRQKKFIKHHSVVKKQESKDYDGMMYS
jgi:DNA-binding MarR family transcriptional regulator